MSSSQFDIAKRLKEIDSASSLGVASFIQGSLKTSKTKRHKLLDTLNKSINVEKGSIYDYDRRVGALLGEDHEQGWFWGGSQLRQTLVAIEDYRRKIKHQFTKEEILELDTIEDKMTPAELLERIKVLASYNLWDKVTFYSLCYFDALCNQATSKPHEQWNHFQDALSILRFIGDHIDYHWYQTLRHQVYKQMCELVLKNNLYAHEAHMGHTFFSAMVAIYLNQNPFNTSTTIQDHFELLNSGYYQQQRELRSEIREAKDNYGVTAYRSVKERNEQKIQKIQEQIDTLERIIKKLSNRFTTKPEAFQMLCDYYQEPRGDADLFHHFMFRAALLVSAEEYNPFYTRFDGKLIPLRDRCFPANNWGHFSEARPIAVFLEVVRSYLNPQAGPLPSRKQITLQGKAIGDSFGIHYTAHEKYECFQPNAFDFNHWPMGMDKNTEYHVWDTLMHIEHGMTSFLVSLAEKQALYSGNAQGWADFCLSLCPFIARLQDNDAPGQPSWYQQYQSFIEARKMFGFAEGFDFNDATQVQRLVLVDAMCSNMALPFDKTQKILHALHLKKLPSSLESFHKIEGQLNWKQLSCVLSKQGIDETDLARFKSILSKTIEQAIDENSVYASAKKLFDFVKQAPTLETVSKLKTLFSILKDELPSEKENPLHKPTAKLLQALEAFNFTPEDKDGLFKVLSEAPLDKIEHLMQGIAFINAANHVETHARHLKVINSSLTLVDELTEEEVTTLEHDNGKTALVY